MPNVPNLRNATVHRAGLQAVLSWFIYDTISRWCRMQARGDGIFDIADLLVLNSNNRDAVDPPAAVGGAAAAIPGAWETKLEQGDANSHLRRMARLLDHRAAVLVAGAAGMPSVHTVWVDCSPHRGWLDKLDERKLMNSAYSLADRDDEYMRRLQGLAGGTVSGPAQANASEVLSQHVLSVIKQYRKAIIASQVVCLAPIVETAMVELVEELQDAESNLQLRTSTELSADFGQELGDQDHDLDVHDAGTVKLLVRVIRRHAELAPRFCQTAGKLVAYRAALQHGSATTTRRLQGMHVEAVRGRRLWVEWMRDPKRVQLIKTIASRFMSVPENSALTFDWVSEALLKLDREQQPDIELAANNNAQQPAPGQPAAQPRGSIYSL